MDVNLDSLPVCLALALAMVGSLFFGKKWGLTGFSDDKDSAKAWVGVVDGPIISLYGLLLAFTFYGAMQRFDDRRKLTVQETNIISSAYRELDRLLPRDREKILPLLQEYVESRLKTHRVNADTLAIKNQFTHSRELQNKIWQLSMEAVYQPGTKPDASKLLGTVDRLINITTERATIPQFHPPWQVMAMFILLAMVSSFLIGFQISTIKRKSWPHLAFFILILTLVTYLIIDLEYPYVGFIRITESEKIFESLLASLKI